MIDKVHIEERVALLRKRAAERCNIEEAECHLGHLSLQAMLDESEKIHQIDAATGGSETNKSVARRTCRLANAMLKYGLKPGDTVVIMSRNTLNVCIPYYACHFGGFTMCTVDPTCGADDLNKLFLYVQPKMVFCQKTCEDVIKGAIKVNKQRGEVVIMDDKTADMDLFVRNYNGTHVNFRPPILDQSKTMAWLILTSGTTGVPKVAMIPFDTLLSGMMSWWKPFTSKVEVVMAMATLQWLTSLGFFTSTPLKGFTRVQSSVPLVPAKLNTLINTYKPNVTAWSPYLLGQFLDAAENQCDLSCFKYVVISGSAIEKTLVQRLKTKCPALLLLVYGMTELLAPVFDFNDKTPFGAVGKRLDKFQYRLMDDNNQPMKKPFKNGELWIKGRERNPFFKGYLNDPEETAKILTEDGWFMTGDWFYRDDDDYYYFVERKRLVIKHFGFKISPLQMEEIIKRHSGVAEACVVSLPDQSCLELPIAAILKRNGDAVVPQDIFKLLKVNLAQTKKLKIAMFFVDSFPVTPSGKIHRAKVKELAVTAQKIILDLDENM